MPDIKAYDPKSAKESLLPLYQNVYKFEIERKDALNARLNFPIAILTLVIGTITLFIKELPKIDGTSLGTLFYILLAVLLLTLVLTLYFFSRSILGYKYAYLQPLGTIDSVVKSIKKYNDQVEADKKRDIDIELTIFLLEQYRKSSDINGDLNKRKLGYFRRTLYCMFITFSILSAETVVFGFIKYKQPSSHQLVEIANKNDNAEVHKVEIINNSENPPHFLLVQPTQSEVTTTNKTDKKVTEELAMNGDDKEQTTNEKPEEPIKWPSEPERRDEADVEPRDILKQDKDLLNEEKP